MSYNSDTLILRVTFVSGMVYEYQGVPQHVFDEMKKASSKGTYLNRHIKGKFRFSRVKSPE